MQQQCDTYLPGAAVYSSSVLPLLKGQQNNKYGTGRTLPQQYHQQCSSNSRTSSRREAPPEIEGPQQWQMHTPAELKLEE